MHLVSPILFQHQQHTKCVDKQYEFTVTWTIVAGDESACDVTSALLIRFSTGANKDNNFRDKGFAKLSLIFCIVINKLMNSSRYRRQLETCFVRNRGTD